MADDIKFIETDAQTTYDTLMSRLFEYCDEALYPADERRLFAEALAAVFIAQNNDYNDNNKQKLLRFARGGVLDALGERYGVYRAAATSATTVFRFEVTAVQDSNIIITLGTRITTDGSVYFETTEAAVLQAGNTFVDVAGACKVGGAEHNGYIVGQIATLVDLVPYVAVSNITISSGGDDGEPYDEAGDDRFRERIRLAPSMLSTAGSESSYRYHVMAADSDIVDVAVIVPSACEVNIYPLLKDGVIPDEDTLLKVAEALGKDVIPMTDKVTVIAPTQVNYNLEFTYYCKEDDEAAVITAVEGESGAVEQYIKWQCEGMGRAINPDKLRHLLFEAGATRVDIVSPTYTPIDANEVAVKSGVSVISHQTE